MIQRKSIVFFFLLLATLGSTAQELSTGFVFTSAENYSRIATAQLPIAGGEFPARIDMSKDMPPVGRQQPQNSCVAWSMAYACKSYQEKIKGNYNYLSGGQLDQSKVFSPSFLYNLINNGQNVGTSFEDACNVLKDYGVCTWQTMPYNPNDWVTRPNAAQVAEAKTYRIQTYRKLVLNDVVTNIKAQLFAGLPVIVATVVDVNYYNGGFNTTQNPYIWTSSGPIDPRMGHAILIVGYDDANNAFKFINSWGSNWGNNGYGWISYNRAPNVIREAYIIKSSLMPNTNVAEPQENPLYRDDNNLDNNDISAGLNFNITNVMHDNSLNNPGIPVQQAKMTIQGMVQAPRNIGRNLQIVVNFYVNNNGLKGFPVGSLDRRFALATGQAATGTPAIPLNPNVALNTGWFAIMPYVVLNVPRGQMTPWGYRPATSFLLAEPVLFIDNFPVRVGQLIPFSVTL
jgi:C1A family cysteine protease